MSLENFGILHGLCNTENSDEVVGEAFESATKGQLISHLKEQENYLKVSDKKVSDKMNLIELKGTYIGYFVYPINSLKRDRVQSYRIDEMEDRFIPESMGGKGWEKGNFDCLQIINIEKPLKELTLGNHIGRKFFMQLIDLDEEEYNFIKDYDDKIKQLTLVIKNNKPLPQLSVKKAKEDLETRYTEMRDAIHDGMFQTEKRKKFPINRYDSYIGWSEG